MKPGSKPDPFTAKAQKQGFPARSVFKLEEIHRRCQLFRTGQRVLDLGAAPGSWTRFIAQRVGPRGSVFAVDLNPLKIAPMPQIASEQLDIVETPIELMSPSWTKTRTLAKATPDSAAAKRPRWWTSCSQPMGNRPNSRARKRVIARPCHPRQCRSGR